MNPNTPRLLDQLRDRIRLKHYSIRTEHAYVDWVRRFVRFHGMRHPREMGQKEVEEFLTELAVAGRVAASTQNQAKSAILFLYKEVMGLELPWLSGVESAKRPQRLPVVLTPQEVQSALVHVSGDNWAGAPASVRDGHAHPRSFTTAREGLGLRPARDSGP